MADSVVIINGVVALLDALPTAQDGSAKVANRQQFAIDVVGVVAPEYQPDFDALETAKITAESLASAREQELLGIRPQLDTYVAAISALRGALLGENSDLGAAQSILSTLP